ncbi:BldC family transcriptional regulator [Streptomyces sp. OK228]|uniref:BldC family transcriptional regulator n=1 Tax=Streptomyces sp. OK228 TaxID=1882786 RepID=UPI003F9147F2
MQILPVLRARRRRHDARLQRPRMTSHPLKEVDTLEAESLLTPTEVATLFRVDPRTVTRWARAGKLTTVRTVGGVRRYPEKEVRELLEESRSERIA